MSPSKWKRKVKAWGREMPQRKRQKRFKARRWRKRARTKDCGWPLEAGNSPKPVTNKHMETSGLKRKTIDFAKAQMSKETDSLLELPKKEHGAAGTGFSPVRSDSELLNGRTVR